MSTNVPTLGNNMLRLQIKWKLRCPKVGKSCQQGLPGQTHKFCEENQPGKAKPSKKREVVLGISASPDQMPAHTASLLCSALRMLLQRQQNLSGKGKVPSKEHPAFALCKIERLADGKGALAILLEFWGFLGAGFFFFLFWFGFFLPFF